jgi:hypothetical protein
VRRLRHSGLVLLIAGAGFLVSPAHAGLYVCNSRTMTSTDYVAMKHAATKTAAAHELDWSHVSPCMNPGSGRAWIPAKPEPQPDGTRVDFVAICERRQAPWKCQVQAQRRYTFSMPISGRRQEFELDLPMDLGVDETRAFVAQAFEEGATLSVFDACNRRADTPRTANDDEENRSLHDTFTAGEQLFQGSIEVGDGSMTLSTASYAFEFSRASPSDPWTFKCCWVVIVLA